MNGTLRPRLLDGWAMPTSGRAGGSSPRGHPGLVAAVCLDGHLLSSGTTALRTPSGKG